MREEYFKDFYQEKKKEGENCEEEGEIDGVGRDDENFLTLFSFWDEKNQKRNTNLQTSCLEMIFIYFCTYL